jgi:hypothetical protein
MKLRSTHYILGIAGIAIAGFIIWGVTQKSGPGPADALAQCLTEKGVKMYGAYWCPHCQDQKKMFGNSWQYITYIECSLPGGRGQTQECTDAGVKSYPTWMFSGGEPKILNGVQSFTALAEASGCAFAGESQEVPVPTGEGMDREGNTISTTTTTDETPAAE